MPANTEAGCLENSAEPRKLGLHRVYPHPDDELTNTEVDIVAIHGLDTQSPTAWEAWEDGDRDRPVHWLRHEKMLPSIIENARIFTYDWNASYDENSSHATLLGMANGLLERLRIQRSKDEIKRPIVFVASCFGGLLLIKALHRAQEAPDYQDIFEFTVGAVFLGTPFQGSDQSFYNAAQVRINVALSAGGEVSKQMVEYLNNSDGERRELDELVQRFRELHRQKAYEFPMICFYETQETDFTKVIDKLSPEHVSSLGSKHKGILVPEHSACLQGLTALPLEVRHSMLNKYANPEDDAFGVVSFRIKELVDGARKTLREKGIVSLCESDEWIIENCYTSQRLKIERLSGSELSTEKCYVNLAIIEQPERDGSGKESKKSPAQSSPFSLATRLKVETPGKNIQVELPKIFDSRKRPDGTTIQPRRILIRGQAGVGKTTLCKKIVDDFIKVDMWRNLFDRILWVPLRSLKNKPDKGYTPEGLFLKNFFFGAPRGDDLARALKAALDNSGYSRTLWVFDGLDEIPEAFYKGNEMYSLLEFLLDRPNVIITSRPSAKIPSYLHPDLELETIGFYPDQVTDYLNKVFEETPHEVEQVESFLRKNKLIHSLVRIPIQLDALCFLWDQKLPLETATLRTMTMIYVALEEGLWEKDARRLDIKSPKTVENARPNEMQHFIDPIPTILELLAFNGMCNNVVEFRPEYRDIVLKHINLFDKNLTLADVLGNVSFLRTSDPSVKNDKRSYHFLHLTYQEFFAAKYFVRNWQDAKEVEYYSDPEDQRSWTKTSPKDFLRKFKYSARYDMVWRFAAGLFGFEVSDFFESIEDRPLDLVGPTHQRLIMHCLSETDPSACPETRSILEARLLQWVLFECDLTGVSHLIADNEFPQRALHSALHKGDPIQRVDILYSLSFFSKHISMETVEYVAKLLETTDTEVKYAVIGALGNRPDLPDQILTRLVVLLEDPDEVDFVLSKANETLGMQSSLSSGGITKVVGLIKNCIAFQLEVATIPPGRIREATETIIAAAGALKRQPTLPEGAVSTLMGLILDYATAEDATATSKALEKPINLPKETTTTLEALLGNTCKTTHSVIWRPRIGALKGEANLSETDIQDIQKAASQGLQGQSSLSEKNITVLITLVKFADVWTKSCAADILKRQSNFSERIVAAFVSLFRDQHMERNKPDIWKVAFYALKDRANLPQQTIHTLIQLLENADCKVQEYAATILVNQSKLSGEAETMLQTLTRNSNAIIQYTAARALNQQSSLSKQTVMALLQLHTDKNWLLLGYEATALSEQSNVTQIITDLIALPKDNHWLENKFVIEILEAQSNLSEQTRAALIEILGGSNVVARDHAVRVLQTQPALSTKNIEALIALLKNESEVINVAATQVLERHTRLSQWVIEAVVRKLKNAGSSDLCRIVLGLEKERDLSRSEIEFITDLLEEGLGIEQSAIARVLSYRSNLPKRTIAALIQIAKRSNCREDVIMALGKQQELSDEAITALVPLLKDWQMEVRRAVQDILHSRSNWPWSVIEALVPLLANTDNHVRPHPRDIMRRRKQSEVESLLQPPKVQDIQPTLDLLTGRQWTFIQNVLEVVEVFSGSKKPAGERFSLQADEHKRLKISHSDESRTALQLIGNLYEYLLCHSFREQCWLQIDGDLNLSFHQPNGSQTARFNLELSDEVQNWRRRLNPRCYNLY
ncbi:hypothetical protein ANO14919_103600 [Xylariales sp. No.14919]|nr:hypothetical protein ANO14919_103600 [Xylariales sp. No.14919]